MPATSGTATGYLDLLDRLRRFVCGYATAGTPSFSGTGNGTMTGVDTTPSAVTETWTVTCITKVSNGGVFSVTGSVSGAKADATVGTPYDNGLVLFTLNDGTTDFEVDDEFTLAVTAGALGSQAWVQKRWVPDDELILCGPGLAGLDEIYVGIKAYSSVPDDYYNWRLSGFIGFDSDMSFDGQPGALAETTPRIPLWNQSTPYWIVASGRRFILVAKVSTTYQAIYLGFIRPYATPGQYPYPLAIGGSSTCYTSERWSAQGFDARQFVDPSCYLAPRSQLRLRGPDGIWEYFKNHAYNDVLSAGINVWPYYGAGGTGPLARPSNIREGVDGSYPLLPLVLHKDSPANIFGELDGCLHVSGHNNAVENIVTDGSAKEYLVVQNVYRTSKDAYWALLLE